MQTSRQANAHQRACARVQAFIWIKSQIWDADHDDSRDRNGFHEDSECTHKPRLLNRWTIKIGFTHTQTHATSICSFSPINILDSDSWCRSSFSIFPEHYFRTEMCVHPIVLAFDSMRWFALTLFFSLLMLFLLKVKSILNEQFKSSLIINCRARARARMLVPLFDFCFGELNACIFARTVPTGLCVRVRIKWCDSSKWRFCVYITSHHQPIEQMNLVARKKTINAHRLLN